MAIDDAMDLILRLDCLAGVGAKMSPKLRALHQNLDRRFRDRQRPFTQEALDDWSRRLKETIRTALRKNGDGFAN